MNSTKYYHLTVYKKLDQLAILNKSKSSVLPCRSGTTPKTNVWALLTIINYVFMFVYKYTGIFL